MRCTTAESETVGIIHFLADSEKTLQPITKTRAWTDASNKDMMVSVYSSAQNTVIQIGRWSEEGGGGWSALRGGGGGMIATNRSSNLSSKRGHLSIIIDLE